MSTGVACLTASHSHPAPPQLEPYLAYREHSVNIRQMEEWMNGHRSWTVWKESQGKISLWDGQSEKIQGERLLDTGLESWQERGLVKNGVDQRARRGLRCVCSNGKCHCISKSCWRDLGLHKEKLWPQMEWVPLWLLGEECMWGEPQKLGVEDLTGNTWTARSEGCVGLLKFPLSLGFQALLLKWFRRTS